MVTIEVSEDIWRTLMVRKHPGDSFDDVLRRELLSADEEGEPQAESADHYDELEFPRGVDRDEAVGAIEAAVALLEREGQATMREIVNAVLPEHPVGYEVETVEPGDRYRGSWWRRVVKPGLEQHPNVAKPDGGRRAWEWRG